MKKIIYFGICMFFYIHGYSASDRFDLDIKYIPDSLKQNAFAVIRQSTYNFQVISTTLATEKKTVEITILENKGKEFADFVYPTDKFRQLNEFSAKIYSAEGKLIRKLKFSDLSSTEYSNDLATDDKYFFLSPELPSYPITVVYEYEATWKKGIITYPLFYPINHHHTSLQQSSYTLTIPNTIKFRSKYVNFDYSPKTTESKDNKIYKWAIENKIAIPSEALQPSLKKRVPMLYLAPNEIDYDGYKGTITDWNTLGKWESQLLFGREELTPEFKTQILEMTSSAKTDREKVKILYDYLGNTTRYVSIQLGVGGYQPMKAAEVCRTGFGDCKGLSNYLKAMLAVAGIDSKYVSIQASQTEKNLFLDYANFNQCNHVILMVPLKNDTLWLECTNPNNPLGFIHNSISGHDAVVYDSNGAEIIQLPDYNEALSFEKNIAVIKLNDNGSALTSSQKTGYVKMYDELSWFSKARPDQQKDFLRKEIEIPNATIGDVKYTENKSSFPDITITYDWNSSLYGTKSGNRLFVPINPFAYKFTGLKNSKRHQPISIQDGFNHIDSISIVIPNGYVIENLPVSCTHKSPFANFESKITQNNNCVSISQSVHFFSGEYPPEKYQEFVSFIQKINAARLSKIILRKS